jgi:hypothetical protein
MRAWLLRRKCPSGTLGNLAVPPQSNGDASRIPDSKERHRTKGETRSAP